MTYIRKNKSDIFKGFLIALLVFFVVFYTVFWYGRYGKSIAIVSSFYDSENIAFFQQYSDEVESYEDIPDWVYTKMTFIKDNTSFTRFGSYYNTLIYGNKVPRLIYNAGRGKCEEFSIVAGCIAVAIGYDVRLVVTLSPGDHTWIEVSVDGKWVHLDPSERLIDDPLFYLHHNRPLGKVLAFTSKGCEDISWKYNTSN